MAMDVYKQYQETAVTQADPVKLVEMLYEGAIRFARLAQKAIEKQDPEGAHNYILRTYAIVAELMATLDFEKGGEIAVHLEQCYDYILHLLKEANIKKDEATLDQVVELLLPLLKSWQDAFVNGVPVGDDDAELNGSESEQLAPDQSEATPPESNESTKSTKTHENKSLDIVG